MVNAELLRAGRLRPIRRVEYDQLVTAGAFDDERVELLYGLLVHVSPQSAPHAFAVQQLTRLLSDAVGAGAILRVQSPLAISDDSEPEPDAAIVANGDYSRAHPTTALLVIEVSGSSLREDRIVKSELYANAEIPEYWIVDVANQRVERHMDPRDGAYGQISSFAPGDSIEAACLPGAAIPIGSLFGS